MAGRSRRTTPAGPASPQPAELRRAFADRLREVRRHRGKTQVQLAAEIGCPVWKLSRIECALISYPPSFEVLLALREALHASLDYLLAGAGSEVPHDSRIAERMTAINRLSSEKTERLLGILDVLLSEGETAAPVEPARR